MSFDKLLHQPRVPVFTGISLVTTVAVETLILWIAVQIPGTGTNAIGGFVFLAFLLVAGGLINAVVGTAAHWRGEFWGGRIAGLGTTAWFVTLVVLLYLW